MISLYLLNCLLSSVQNETKNEIKTTTTTKHHLCSTKIWSDVKVNKNCSCLLFLLRHTVYLVCKTFFILR